MATTMQWDDVQYFLAIVERGSIGAAAKWLRVNHSTVLRRVASLERTLAVRLFDRLPTGYVLTPHGHELAASIVGVAEQFETAQRRLAGGDLELKGPVRLTSPEPLLQGLLMPFLAEFQVLHPQVRLELVVNSSLLNLTQREADVAVRGTNHPPDNLIGRPVGSIRTALYGSRAYLKTLRRNHSEEDYRWVGLDESLGYFESAKWMRKNVPDRSVSLRVDSLTALVGAVAAGFGVGWLLCPLADVRKELVRLREPLPSMDTRIWVLTHPDLRGVARIQAMTQFLYKRLSSDPRLLHT